MKLLFITSICSLIISGCSTQPVKSTSLNVDRSLNGVEVNQTSEKFLPTATLFLPYGGLLDLRVGTTPFYWYSKNPGDPPIVKDLTSMMNFETGKNKVITENSSMTKIRRISYGTYDQAEYKTFLNNLFENDYVVNIEITDFKQDPKPEETGTQQQNAPSAAKNSNENNNTNTSKKYLNTDGLTVPYLIFAYNKDTASQFEIVSPSNILSFKNKRKFENSEFFLAAYPSIFTVLPGKDLAEYYDHFKEEFAKTNFNKFSDCEGFARDPNFVTGLRTDLTAINSNCPTSKFWVVNFLITAKAVKYLNKTAILSEINGDVEIPDNSLSAINKKLWNVGDGKTVKITYAKKKGTLATSAMQLNDRKTDIFPLNWNCDQPQYCIPAGPAIDKSLNEKDDIPVFAIINLSAEQMSNLIKGYPKVKLNYQMKDVP